LPGDKGDRLMLPLDREAQHVHAEKPLSTCY
jgi:hypothetical protein